MTWRVTNVIDQRREFISSWKENQYSFAELCREFNISRKTGYKWLNRFQEDGEKGLEDKNKAPLNHPNKTKEEHESTILKVKRKYSTWGPKKVQAYLQRELPGEDWPSSTTIGNILDRHGLVTPRIYRRRMPAKTDPLSHCNAPNDVWCGDFKGGFRTKDETYCAPLTVTDAYSRYLFTCINLTHNDVDRVWNELAKLFREYGLPLFLRHDNGPPFATSGPGRLSRLSVNLVKVGVTPEWIDPGKPYQNGRHERMHLTLKNEASKPREFTLDEQQMKFSDFRNYYNYERPHEGIGQEIPGKIYIPSDRQWDGTFRSPEYSKEFIVRRIRGRGLLSWGGKDIYIGKTLKNEDVGLLETATGEWIVYFGPVVLGLINKEKRFLIPRREVRPIRKHKVKIF